MARLKSVKDWRPDPVQAVLDFLDRNSVDSSAWKDWNTKTPPAHLQTVVEKADDALKCVALPVKEGTLYAFHVTDDPEAVKEQLRSGKDFLETTHWFTRMCPGLMVSSVPHYWKRYVSSSRYEFLKHLDHGQKTDLYAILLRELESQVNSHYITQSEHEVAVRDLDYWYDKGMDYGIMRVVEQPYNIDVPKIALENKIAVPKEPKFVDVYFKGKFLDMEDQDTYEAIMELSALIDRGKSMLDVCKVLREYGWSGSFTKSGMGTEAQLFIMRKESIIKYGDWIR